MPILARGSILFILSKILLSFFSFLFSVRWNFARKVSTTQTSCFPLRLKTFRRLEIRRSAIDVSNWNFCRHLQTGWAVRTHNNNSWPSTSIRLRFSDKTSLGVVCRNDLHSTRESIWRRRTILVSVNIRSNRSRESHSGNLFGRSIIIWKKRIKPILRLLLMLVLLLATDVKWDGYNTSYVKETTKKFIIFWVFNELFFYCRSEIIRKSTDGPVLNITKGKNTVTNVSYQIWKKNIKMMSFSSTFILIVWYFMSIYSEHFFSTSSFLSRQRRSGFAIHRRRGLVRWGCRTNDLHKTRNRTNDLNETRRRTIGLRETGLEQVRSTLVKSFIIRQR